MTPALRAVLPIIGALLSCPRSAAAQETPPPPATPGDIVVTANQPPPSLFRYSADDIGALHAMTIGEVIARLERRNGGRPFSIIVNGRRIGGIADLRDIPPEALSGIRILAESRAGEYGFTPANKILDLVLKPNFAADTLDATIRAPTEGAGKTGSLAIRDVHIRNERRFNAALSLQANQAVTARDRASSLDAGTDDVVSPHRTLTPAGSSVSLTAGLAMPVGSVSVTMSSSITDTASRQISRFAPATDGAAADRPANGVNPVIDLTGTRSYQFGLSASGIARRIDWTTELAASVVTGRARSRRTSTVIDGGLQGVTLGTAPYAPLSASSRSATLDLASTATTRLFSLPAGALTANARIGATIERLASSGTATSSLEQVASQWRSRAHVGLDIPIVDPATPLLGRLGTLSVWGSADHEWARGAGSYPSYSATVDWQPTGFMTLGITRSVSRTLPSLGSSRDAIVYSDGSLVIDAATGDYALVTRISGGTSDLRTVAQHDTTARLSINAPIGTTTMALLLESVSQAIDDPIVVTAYPTALFQRLFPGRFVRDDAGRLRSIDTRPFNALAERRHFLRPSLRLSGHAGRTSGAATAIADDAGVDWDLTITHEWALRDILRPGATADAVDLLGTPLDGVQGKPRHAVTIESSAARRTLSLRVGGRWRSGSRIDDIAAASANPIRYAAFWTADAEIAWTLPTGRHSSGPSRPLRLWLSAENLFDRRSSVRNASGQIPAGFQPTLLDPIGRVVMLRASRAL